MAPRLGSVKPKEFIRRLERSGFLFHHQTGSHVILKGPEGRRISVPKHNREMKRGTLADLIKQAGLTQEEFDRA